MPRLPANSRDVQRGKRLGLALVEARRRTGLTQEELARKARVGIDGLRRLEQGRLVHPSFFTVCAVAAALGVRLDALEGAAR